MVNLTVLDAALARVDLDPASWRQWSFGVQYNSCRTAGCLAFHVGEVLEAEFSWGEPTDLGWRDGDGHGDALTVVAQLNWIDGRTPFSYARDALGLTGADAEELFAGGNTRADLQRMRDALAAGQHLWSPE